MSRLSASATSADPKTSTSEADSAVASAVMAMSTARAAFAQRSTRTRDQRSRRTPAIGANSMNGMQQYGEPDGDPRGRGGSLWREQHDSDQASLEQPVG